MAPKGSGIVDLTIEESDDDDVQFVAEVARQSPSNGSRGRKNANSTVNKHAQSISRTILSTTRNKAPVGPRSEIASPGDSELRPREIASSIPHPAKTKMAARKSGTSGLPAQPRKVRSPQVLSRESSSGDIQGGSLTDRPQFRSDLSGTQSAAVPRSDSFSTMSGRLKRPLDLTSNDLATGQLSKRAKLSESDAKRGLPFEEAPNSAEKRSAQSAIAESQLHQNAGKIPRAELLSKVSRTDQLADAPETETRKEANTPLLKSTPELTKRKTNAGVTSRIDPPNSESANNVQTQQFLGPFGRLQPGLPVALGDFAEVHAFGEKRLARQAQQQAGMQVSRGICADKTTSPQSRTSALPQRHAKGTPQSPAGPSDFSTSAGSSKTKQPGPQKATGGSPPVSSTIGPSIEQTDRPYERSNRDLLAAPSRALNLLNRQSASRPATSAQKRHASSSDEDQGYASLSSSHSGAHRQIQKPEAQTLSVKVLDMHTGKSKPREQDGSARRSPVASNKTLPKLTRTVLTALRAPGPATQTTSAPTVTAGKPIEEPNDAAGRKTPEPRVLPSTKETTNAVEPQVPSANTEIDCTGGISRLSRAEDQRASEVAADAAKADDQLQLEALRDLEQRRSQVWSDPVFAVPQSTASALASTAAYAKLSLAAKVEKVLGQYLEELAEDNEYWTSASLKRSRLSKEIETQAPAALDDAPTSFAHMKPLKLFPRQKTSQKTGQETFTWDIEKMSNGKPMSSEHVIVPQLTFATERKDVPGYAHYVSIKSNILGPNTKTLHCWPYFSDDFEQSKTKNLKEQYHVDISGRELKLLRLRQAQKYEQYVQSVLDDLDCSWSDVLRFLLEPRPTVGIDPDAMKALNNRQEFCKEEFDRDQKRWQAVLQSLAPCRSETLARAAVLCENFQKLARFPLWHIARRSPLCKLPEKTQVSSNVSTASDELTCRICMRFYCPYHGELQEHANDDDEADLSDTSDAGIIATDVVHPPKINYRTRVAFPIPQAAAAPRQEKKDLKYWQSFENKADARRPFYPCSHPDKSCEDAEADCSCYVQNLPCEKFCGCHDNCARKFEGCSCSTQRIRVGKRGPCFDDERCTCWQLGRECDPDLCGGCGVCEVVDPVNKHDDGIPHGRCQNASIQRAVSKSTILGDSGVHGLGLYACEAIKASEFVGEYKGEIITKEEAERRGAVYEHQKLSYLFSLNNDQEIDGTYFGNKIRFINHAIEPKANLYPRIIMVNTVHRIALYAANNIKAGQELFFNYGPKFPNEQLGGKAEKQKKSAPHVRNANLVKTFYEVQDQRDELGELRAKGVPGGGSGRKSKSGKKRGGARPGAGRKPRIMNPQPAPQPENGPRHEVSPFEEESAEQDAGQRLAAYNVADDGSADQGDMDFAAGAGADDDDEEYQESNEDTDEGSAEGESSEDEAAEADGVVRRRPGRPRTERRGRA